jgi:hypothetical protein
VFTLEQRDLRRFATQVSQLSYFRLVCKYSCRYYALAAASALVTYLQNNLNIYNAKASINVSYQESEGYAIIGAYQTVSPVNTQPHLQMSLPPTDWNSFLAPNRPKPPAIPHFSAF